MIFNFQHKVIIAIVLVSFQFTIAQKKENIGSEEVTVVKSYNPSISDASKIKETPSLDDDGNTKKETIKYSIFSFPVASTFAPLKGKAEGVEKTKQAHLFDNYATLGFGNYKTLNAELFVNQDLSNTDYVGGMLRHLSSQGGVNDVELASNYSDTSVDLTYGTNLENFSFNFDLGYKNQIYNWYGLPKDFGSLQTPQDRQNIINSINPQHVYNTFSLGGRFGFKDSFINKADLKFIHFTDTFGTAENRFYAKPSFQFEVGEEVVKTDFIVDYVGGTFDHNYEKNNLEPIKYGYTNVGIAPSFVMLKDDWTLNLGAGIFYSLGSGNSKNALYVYPQVTASYKVVGDLMVFYAGAEGSLEQNSYQNFVDGNPFLSPTIGDNTTSGFIKPTDKQYDIFAGLKGKLVNNVSYNIKASYLNERNKALYRSNDYNENNFTNATNEYYAFGNSYQVVYDDMKTISFTGSLKASFSDNVTFSVGGSFYSFKNDIQQQAWNLPTVKIDSKLDVNITPKWFAGLQVFYVGERMDLQSNTAIITPSTAVTLPSYFDANAHLGYKYSDRLTAFLKGNNLGNQNYQKWLNYPVQGLQILVGANYKFDF